MLGGRPTRWFEPGRAGWSLPHTLLRPVLYC
jgi:hypothetical protein